MTLDDIGVPPTNGRCTDGKQFLPFILLLLYCTGIMGIISDLILVVGNYSR